MSQKSIEYTSAKKVNKRRYSSGQRGLTVNQMALAFVGSNPTRRTNIIKVLHVIMRGFYYILSAIVAHELLHERKDLNRGRETTSSKAKSFVTKSNPVHKI